MYIQFGVPSFVLQESEIGCSRVSYGHILFLLAVPPARVVVRSSVASIRPTAISLPVIVGAIRTFYHLASYTTVAGSRLGGQSYAWVSCIRPGPPSPLISPTDV